jgi:hypothetical protein
MGGAYGGLIIILGYVNLASITPPAGDFLLETDLTPILQTDNTEILLAQ